MDISIRDFIKNSYVISIDDDILYRFNKIFETAGFQQLPTPVSGFKFNSQQFKSDSLMKSVYSGTIKNPKYGALGCGVSHAALVKYADLLNLDFIAIFEDDAYPCDDIIDRLSEQLTGIPDDCDILKLGWSAVYENKDSFDQKFNRKPKSWGTFAYIVFKKYYKRYFENFEKSYISDHDVMRSDSVKTYHARQRLFYYYNQDSDVLIHNGNGNRLNQQPGFSMQYAKDWLPVMNLIEPRPSLLNALKSMPPFLYRPNGGNAGDIVIAFAELQLFDKLRLNYVQINGSNKQKLIDIPFNLVYGGGGGWIDIYRSNCVKQLDTYFKNKNLKKCIILPSTFHKCDDVVTSFDERFTVFCRDPASLEYCKSLNKKATFELHEDMVFQADFSELNLSQLGDLKTKDGAIIRKKLHEYRQKNKSKTANFLRTDREKTIQTSAIPEANLDISQLKNQYGENMSKPEIQEYTKLFLYLINKYQTIYTNRLHVAICSYKLNKKIMCYDNSYGKVFNTLKFSIPSYEKIKFMEVDSSAISPNRNLRIPV